MNTNVSLDGNLLYLANFSWLGQIYHIRNVRGPAKFNQQLAYLGFRNVAVPSL